MDAATEPASPEGKAAPRSASSLVAGTRLGKYLLERWLGAGAMGSVWAATDTDLDRRVAVKVLLAGDQRARLVRESRAMARLRHPNVLTVYDAERFADNDIIVTELIDGETLASWLAKDGRAIDEVMAVVLAAGRGLAAAHTAGIIHRDFKPQNVLVDGHGRAVVTDFGLARAVDTLEPEPATEPKPDPVTGPVAYARGSAQVLGALDGTLTETGAVLGTPAYMSPEQVTGTSADERTDQFAFCVTLWEALAGERPFVGDSMPELTTALTVDPPRAAERVPRRLRSVLARGLAKDPAQRWPSMNALLDAIEHAWRRPRRIRRLAAVAVVAAAVAVAFAAWPQHRASCRVGDDRVAKIWNTARREQMRMTFLASQRPHAAATFGRLVTVVDAWAHSWQLAFVDACEATRLRAEQSDRLLDLRMECLTRRLDEAGATLDLLAKGGGETVDHALDAVAALPSVNACADAASVMSAIAPPDTAAARARVVEIRRQLDQVRSLHSVAQFAAARERAVTAVAAARSLDYAPLVAEALLLLGRVQFDLGEPGAAERLRESMHLATGAGDETGAIAAGTSLASSLIIQAGRYDLAKEMIDLTVAVAAHARPRIELRVPLENARAMLDARLGRIADAEARYRATIESAEKELGTDHRLVLRTLNQLGRVLTTAARYADATATFQRVLSKQQQALGPNHPEVATTLLSLAEVANAQHRFDESIRLAERALAIHIAAFGPDHVDVAAAYMSLGVLHAQQGDHEQAQHDFHSALDIYTRRYGPDHVALAPVYKNIGADLLRQHNPAQARSEGEHALRILEAARGPDDLEIAGVVSNLALVAKAENKLDEARALIGRARQITTKAYGPDHPDVANYDLNEAEILVRQGHLADAIAANERALHAYEKIFGADHVKVGMAWSNLAANQYEQAEYTKAIESDRKALAIFEAKLDKNDALIAYPLVCMGESLTELHRESEAAPALERAVAIRTEAGVPPHLIAEAHYDLAVALAASPSTRARSVDEAQASLDAYVKAKDDKSAAEVRTWMAKHRAKK